MYVTPGPRYLACQLTDDVHGSLRKDTLSKSYPVNSKPQEPSSKPSNAPPLKDSEHPHQPPGRQLIAAILHLPLPTAITTVSNSHKYKSKNNCG